jgi:alpha-glucosidase (family GH31 glycosyl hydrolase)
MAQYKRDLMNEATQNGIPIVRSLMMNFPDDDQSRKITDQFMLGDHIIIAPIFEEGQMFINLYFPPGTWRHLWTGQVFNGPTRATVYAPIG